MYYAFILWLLRGGDTVSIQPTDPTAIPKPRIVGPPLQHAEPTEFRTLSDVEADITITRQLVAIERAKWARQWPSRITHNLVDDRTDYVVELNWYIEEWAALNR